MFSLELCLPFSELVYGSVPEQLCT